MKSHQVFLPLVNSDVDTAFGTYRIPSDNPFVGQQGYRGEIWALGLRNPWRFSFDRDTGDVYIGDVGQYSWEEVDFQPVTSSGGENYGWNEMEGKHCYQNPCDPSSYTPPIYEYPTHEAGSCSITGGFVYRGSEFIGIQGIYFFADYCNGLITGIQWDGVEWQEKVQLDTAINISTFGEDEIGELYIADRSGGNIYKIVEKIP